MEHNLLIMETRVDRFGPRLAVSDVQPTPKPGREKGEEKGETEGMLVYFNTSPPRWSSTLCSRLIINFLSIHRTRVGHIVSFFMRTKRTFRSIIDHTPPVLVFLLEATSRSVARLFSCSSRSSLVWSAEIF